LCVRIHGRRHYYCSGAAETSIKYVHIYYVYTKTMYVPTTQVPSFYLLLIFMCMISFGWFVFSFVLQSELWQTFIFFFFERQLHVAYIPHARAVIFIFTWEAAREKTKIIKLSKKKPISFYNSVVSLDCVLLFFSWTANFQQTTRK